MKFPGSELALTHFKVEGSDDVVFMMNSLLTKVSLYIGDVVSTEPP